MILTTIRDWVSECQFEDYSFHVSESPRGELYLQASYLEPDIITKEPTVQWTRKWLLSPAMTKSEVIQTVFKCALTSFEHRCRENFLYNGKRVFGPHFDVDALHSICNSLDYRLN